MLKRIDQGQQNLAKIQEAVGEAVTQGGLAVGTGGGGISGGGMDIETRGYIRSLDKQLRAMADDVAVGRHETLTALRAELRALTNLIDLRTRSED